METCANCERTIGKLETPHLWQDAVVCGDCIERLRRDSPPAIAELPLNHEETPDEFERRFKAEERGKLAASRPAPAGAAYDPNTEQAVTYGILKAVVIVILILAILALGIIILGKLNGE